MVFTNSPEEARAYLAQERQSNTKTR
jgi:hypothetical protein